MGGAAQGQVRNVLPRLPAPGWAEVRRKLELELSRPMRDIVRENAFLLLNCALVYLDFCDACRGERLLKYALVSKVEKCVAYGVGRGVCNLRCKGQVYKGRTYRCGCVYGMDVKRKRYVYIEMVTSLWTK